MSSHSDQFSPRQSPRPPITTPSQRPSPPTTPQRPPTTTPSQRPSPPTTPQRPPTDVRRIPRPDLGQLQQNRRQRFNRPGLQPHFYDIECHNIGPMTQECRWCKALYYVSESSHGTFNKCCTSGSIVLEAMPVPYPLLQTLLTENNAEARHFRKEIRSYNNALTFTSCRYTPDTQITHQGGVQPFQIHGELFHLQGPLDVETGQLPNYAQLYFYDPAFTNTTRISRATVLRESLLERLTNMLHECHNPFIQYYKTAKECLDSYRQSQGPMRIILNPQMRLIMETGADQRRENLPTANEIAVLIPDEYNEPGHRDIVLTQRLPDGQSTRLHNIPHTHPAYMPLNYVLLFPHENPGWRWSLSLVNENAQRQRTRLSERM